ncbi:MAG: anti-anti-sigma factor [Thiomonas sp. 20-64-9]|uniref:STAS domain-containing protein n=1 Tax=unclassified Thiomonas TaxID=2625466 RepID=UPI000BDAB54E|nr:MULTISPECIES: STAS domain-containing protein [unclassified Thiomonas]OYV31285.1 MAG: anti-anti-sigma factor [Thiomonas sp. 20-64-9]OZB70623.1 MAG: anti-anti-sigma factor [Thiomonas sp. 13-64-67]
MDIIPHQAGPACSVTLQGALDIYAAAEVRNRLAELIAQHPLVELQLAAVDEIDASGVQILLAAKQQASNLEHSLKLSGHSPAVIDALELCGLLAYFGDPVVEFGHTTSPKEHA